MVNPFNHTIAVEFYIGRNFLKEKHYQEIKVYDYYRDLDKARIKAMRPNDNVLEGSIPIHPQSEFAKRYSAILEEFKSQSKMSAI